MRAILFCLINLFALVIPIPANSQSNDFPLQTGHKLKFHSKILKENREVWVYLPPNYHDKHFQIEKYPVLYLLDGDLHFHSVTGMIQALGSGVNGTYAIPEMIVVSILNTDRTRDLTPTHSIKSFDGKERAFLQSSGGGTKFLNFMKDELIPKIDSACRTFPYKMLVGHSFGGLEVLHTLQSQPEVFNAYVAIDPSLWWDQQVLVKSATDYFKTKNLKGRSLFIAQANSLGPGETTNVHYQSIRDYTAILTGQNTSGLWWAYQYYENDHHGAVAFAGTHDALRTLFYNYYAPFSEIKTPEELVAHYRKFSEQIGVSFLPPERVINMYGNVALSRENKELAKHYFQLCVDLYPNSSAAHYNMGQFVANQGDSKRALTFMQRALELYPENQSIKVEIEKLSKLQK